ncbi:ankyrin repeat-containing domain protein [Tuber indicum]|nr:ankyrin repeat-containing domain protein [Tuber indicum]
MPLLSLPNEMILEISLWQSVPDQNSLLSTNKRLAHLLQPNLINAVFRTRSTRYGRRALFAFSCRQDTAAVLYLLERGILSFTGPSTSLINAAIDTQDVNTIRILLDSGFQAGVFRPGLGAPLFLAVKTAKIEVVRLLLSKALYGVDINSGGRHAETPLIAAIYSGSVDIIHLLLGDPSINVNAEGPYGFTALDCAIQRGKVSLIAPLLEDPRVDVSGVNGGRTTPLMIAIREGKMEVVQLLLQNPRVDPRVATQGGVTALHDAIYHFDLNTIEILLQDQSIDINAQAECGCTPLHIASIRNEVAVWALLKDIRTSVNIQNNRGRTALHMAVEAGRKVSIYLLLRDRRVDISIKDHYEATAQSWAKEMYGTDLVSFVQQDPRLRGELLAVDLAQPDGT